MPPLASPDVRVIRSTKYLDRRSSRSHLLGLQDIRKASTKLTDQGHAEHSFPILEPFSTAIGRAAAGDAQSTKRQSKKARKNDFGRKAPFGRSDSARHHFVFTRKPGWLPRWPRRFPGRTPLKSTKSAKMGSETGQNGHQRTLLHPNLVSRPNKIDGKRWFPQR